MRDTAGLGGNVWDGMAKIRGFRGVVHRFWWSKDCPEKPTENWHFGRKLDSQ